MTVSESSADPDIYWNISMGIYYLQVIFSCLVLLQYVVLYFYIACVVIRIQSSEESPQVREIKVYRTDSLDSNDQHK